MMQRIMCTAPSIEWHKRLAEIDGHRWIPVEQYSVIKPFPHEVGAVVDSDGNIIKRISNASTSRD